MAVLTVANLTKKFGTFTAVDSAGFELQEGEILGFLGPNGAGKTTTIQMLLGVLTPTSGSVKYFGKDLYTNREEILERLNFSTTYTNLPWKLSVRENLTFLSYLYTIKNRKAQIARIAEIFKLEELMNMEMHTLSAGQLTRVNLAKAFLNDPDVLLLDEPTASLDPDIASYIRTFLLEERDRMHVSIIFTSHNMAEVEALCDRVIFINHGRIIANDTPEKLARSISVSHVELLLRTGMKRAQEIVTKLNMTYQISGNYITVNVAETRIPELLTALMDHGIQYIEISIEKPTLEDYFLEMAAKKGGSV